MSSARIMKSVQKLFVGNIPWTVGNNELKMYFSKFGHVSSATVVFEKTSGMSKGYGFIVYSTRDGFVSASNNKNHFLDGRYLTTEEADS